MNKKLRKNKHSSPAEWIMTRRVFLKSSAIAAIGILFQPLAGNSDNVPKQTLVSFGAVTDSHYADIESQGTRYYRESTDKMIECISLMNDKEVDFVIHLGDFINGTPSSNLENLRLLESIYRQFNGPRYHVLGNHDMDGISKIQFNSVIKNTGIHENATFYSFDQGGVHFVVLDANFREDDTPYNAGNFTWSDANIPREQLQWLDTDLTRTSNPTVICIHQLIDGDNGGHYVRNANEVRRILEKHSHVLMVLQGHQHLGQYNQINGIHYWTLKAMVEYSGQENNSYTIVQVYDDMSLEITGFRRAISKELIQ